MPEDTIFSKIVRGEAPADIVYRDDRVTAFRDIHPQAPTHILIIPRKHVATINELTTDDEQIIGKVFLAAQEIARQEGIDEAGYRVVMNCNEGAGQTVFHIHLHVLGGRGFSWPPG